MNKYPDSPIIELKGIRKHFEGFHLDGIDIDLYKGEVHVLVGENGSGKSTLMKLLSGWFTPESGTILYKGKPVSFRSIHESRSKGIIYLHQDVQSFFNLTVAENVYFGHLPRLWGIKTFFDKDRVHADCRTIFQELGINIDPEAMLGTLGYAARQLVSATQGYISGADVIIFDEPSSAMTDPDRTILFDIVQRLKESEKAIFYISHRMDEIKQIGDRVSVIHKGHITDTRYCNGVDREGLVTMMTGDIYKERYPRMATRQGPELMSVQNITYEPILKGVSFNLHKGEILGITGLMGSGRTLLANCLFGNIKPTGGTVYMNESKVNFKHPKEAMIRGISFIPEDRAENGIFPQHNLIKNMTTATLERFKKGVILNEPCMQKLTQDYVQEMNIKPGQSEDILKTYSGGNQQKVIISRWLMNLSRIYIMDEPTRGIDVASKIDIYNTMNDMVDKGASIILISSEIEEILGMSDRILVLAGGRIACEMNRKQASKEKILEYATGDS